MLGIIKGSLQGGIAIVGYFVDEFRHSNSKILFLALLAILLNN